MLLSLFLLHKATKPVVSAEELQLVRRRRSAWPCLFFTKIPNKSFTLLLKYYDGGTDVATVCGPRLRQRGAVPQIWNKVDSDETGWLDNKGVGEVLAMLGEEISDKKLAKVIDEIGADAHGRVLARDFVRETSQKSPTQVAVLQ